TFIWDATGSYWVVDAGAFEKPTYISTTQTLTAVKKMIAVVNTSGVVLTLDAGPYDGFELPVLATADCQIVYTGVNGSITKNVQANTYNEFVWGGTYWLPRESTAITGIDDNGQPFAFNIDSLVKPDGVINLTGTDANGNPFDYGLGKLVLAADEDNLVTGVEVKTSKTFNGKPVYEMLYDFTLTSYTDSTKMRQFTFKENDWRLIRNCSWHSCKRNPKKPSKNYREWAEIRSIRINWTKFMAPLRTFTSTNKTPIGRWHTTN
ncbi:MAG: hypothetical protein II502_02050, partial [Paludibacteraceae bacterium]|nr:hypothetical protein [Paludibacteraceae bacterium]